MQTNRYQGLSAEQVAASRKNNGSNVLTPKKGEPLWKQYLEKFGDPLIQILLVAGALSVGISCYEFFRLDEGERVFFEPAGIFLAIFLATGLAFWFELQANKAFAILNQVNDDEPVQVIREGKTTQVPKRDIVVGDIVVLGTGAEVPADGELLEATALTMDESSLTGEPLCRKTTNEAHYDSEATFPSNKVLRGTIVMEGHAVFRVDAVGDKTENGKIFQNLAGRDDADDRIEELTAKQKDEPLTKEELKELKQLKRGKIDRTVKTPLNEQLDGLSALITNLSYGFAALIIVGKLFVFFGFAWQSWLLLIPTALFFWYVIRKSGEEEDEDEDEGWRGKLEWAGAIGIYFAVFIGGVLWLHDMLNPHQDITHLLAYTLQTLMVAVTLIVVAVPEGLPMAVTLSLAYSMRRMLKTNNLVRRMHACETMGATTVICTDKTGTLTQNQMRVDEVKVYAQTDPRLLHEGMAVNSTASLDLAQAKPQVLGNPTEGALLLWLREHGADYQQMRAEARVVDELPFSTERKYMATLVVSAITGRRTLYVKGAPEIVLAMCGRSRAGRDMVDKQLAAWQARAMRTLGFAWQELAEDETAIADGRVVASNLEFLGIAAIADPVREDVPAAIRECLDAGIAVKIVTGDTPGTAREIARQTGLMGENDNPGCIITGPEFAALSDEELRERVRELKVIARARPMDKKRLVEALQARGEVVAVTGDGTNDAPALNAAHVGLSMGDGTAVAKEASDITIIDNSFSSIGRAVMWGRSLYQNIQRFLLFQLTVNVSACFIVLAGAFMGTESPLTVTQMLWVNLIMDTFGAMALASLPPTERVMQDKPRRREAFILGGDMIWNILGVGGAFFLMLLGLLYVFQHADVASMADFLHLRLGPAGEVTPYEQTLLFSIFVWTHFWYMFCSRAFYTGQSILRTPLSRGFLTIVGVIVAGQVLIVEVGYEFFNVAPMFHNAAHPSGPADFCIIVGLSASVLLIREVWSLLKRLF